VLSGVCAASLLTGACGIGFLVFLATRFARFAPP
jgi:hypothetical protein